MRLRSCWELFLSPLQEATYVDSVQHWLTSSLPTGLDCVSPWQSLCYAAVTHSQHMTDPASVLLFAECSARTGRQGLHCFHYPTGSPLGSDCVGTGREKENELGGSIWVVCLRDGAGTANGRNGYMPQYSPELFRLEGTTNYNIKNKCSLGTFVRFRE